MHSCTHMQHCMLHAYPRTQTTARTHTHTTLHAACTSTHKTAARTHIQPCMNIHTHSRRTHGHSWVGLVELEWQMFPLRGSPSFRIRATTDSGWIGMAKKGLFCMQGWARHAGVGGGACRSG